MTGDQQQSDNPTSESPQFVALRKQLEETKQQLEELAREVEPLEHFFDFSLDLLCLVSFEGRYLRVNPAFQRLLGYAPEELIGTACYSLVHPEDQAKARSFFEQVRHGNPLQGCEVRMLHKSGRALWISWTLVSWPERNIIYGIGRDVTRQKEIEHALRESEEKYRLLVEKAGEVIYCIDVNGLVEYVSPAVRQLAGYEPEELVGRDFTSVFLPEERQRLRENFARILRGEQMVNEYRVYTKSGEVRWVRTSSHPHIHEGQLLGIYGVLADITDLKSAEAALKESYDLLEQRVEERTTQLAEANRQLQQEVAMREQAEKALSESESLLRAMLENLPLDFCACTLDGICFVQSRRSVECWDDCRGKPFAEQIADPAFRRYWSEAFAKATQGKAVEGQMEVHTRSSQHMFVASIIAPIFLENRVVGVLGVNVDLTEQKRVEAAIRQEQERLRRLLEVQERQQRLIAYEIHDGFVQEATGALLFLEGMPEDVDLRINHAHRRLELAVAALRRGIAEARHLINGLRPPQLEELGVIAALESYIRDRQLQSGIPISFSHRVRFERLAPPLESAIFRIVQEAVNNAIRHSETDRIDVSLEQHDDWLQLVVADYGRGFDPTNVPADRFGLEGIRERARLFGGKAEIYSSPGQGTRIVVELPLHVA